MACTIKLADGIVHVNLTEHLTLSDLREIGDELVKIEAEQERSPHRLTDMTYCESGKIDLGQLETLARRRRDAPLKNPVRSAIIATTPMHYGIARMYMAIGSNPKVEMEIFEKREDALAWLGQNDQKQ